MQNDPASLMLLREGKDLTTLIVAFVVLVFALGAALPANHEVRYFR